MAQVKIYGLKSSLPKYQEQLSATVHATICTAINYPVEKKFQRFFLFEPSDFIYPRDRTENYTIIEISMFEGRSVETKKNLIRLLFANIQAQVGIAPMDLEITILEMPKSNWGVRGLPGDELSLNYKVDV
jgi:phenylpyruvate tautomerase PptA (4-oxalocrotonate tautomerase family)